ncbi:hypothetical protein H0H93_008787 [Arthromyces matolae]|nr:hypothetical protein H0H93_008787 [Arthromyces matolae]
MNSLRPSEQQFYTDPTSGINYSRYGDASPWFPMAPTGSYPAFEASVFGPQQAKHTMEAGQLGPVAGSSTSKDPARIPLPDDDDDDFPPVDRILAKVARPAVKVGGARVRTTDVKGKGKARAEGPSLKRKTPSTMGSEEPESKKPKRGGRSAGVANYTNEDVEGLLDIVEEYLPIGGNAWNSCADEFSEWARENGRPVRTAKSLEAKFKQLVKTSKPTGDAECPPSIERAHAIENSINEKAGTRDLDDIDIVDTYDEPIEISDEDDEEPKSKVQALSGRRAKHIKKSIKAEPDATPQLIARRLPTDRITSTAPRNRGGQAHAILSQISSALDPEAQAARDDQRASRSLHTTHILTLSQQIRDLHGTIESLRSRLAESDRERHAAERRADKAELMSMMSGRGPSFTPQHPRHHTSTRSTPYPHQNRRYFETRYPDGGRHVQYLSSDPDDAIAHNHASMRTPSPGFQQILHETPSPLLTIQPPASSQRKYDTPRPRSVRDASDVTHFRGDAFSVTVTPCKETQGFAVKIGSPSLGHGNAKGSPSHTQAEN